LRRVVTVITPETLKRRSDEAGCCAAGARDGKPYYMTGRKIMHVNMCLNVHIQSVSGGEERQNYAEQKNGDLQREVSLQRIVPFASRDTLSNSYYSGRYPKNQALERVSQPWKVS
jgi:hypothetical protein